MNTTYSPTFLALFNPDGVLVRSLRYALSALFVFFAISKILNLQGSTQWLGDLHLQGATIWAISLLQLIIAGFLLWRVTYPLAAVFIILHSSELLWISFAETGDFLFSGLILVAVSIFLIVSDRMELDL